MAKKGVTLKAKVTRRQMVPPVNVIKLMDEIGGTRTAAKLGVSTTLLYKAKNENAINKVVEVAAASALGSLGQPERPMPSFGAIPPRGGEVMFMVTLPADKVDVFHRMVSAMGGVAMSA